MAFKKNSITNYREDLIKQLSFKSDSQYKLDEDHFYTRENCQKLLRNRLIVKRASSSTKIISDQISSKISIEESTNWPMLVLRNDFAQ